MRCLRTVIFSVCAHFSLSSVYAQQFQIPPRPTKATSIHVKGYALAKAIQESWGERSTSIGFPLNQPVQTLKVINEMNLASNPFVSKNSGFDKITYFSFIYFRTPSMGQLSGYPAQSFAGVDLSQYEKHGYPQGGFFENPYFPAGIHGHYNNGQELSVGGCIISYPLVKKSQRFEIDPPRTVFVNCINNNKNSGLSYESINERYEVGTFDVSYVVDYDPNKRK